MAPLIVRDYFGIPKATIQITVPDTTAILFSLVQKQDLNPVKFQDPVYALIQARDNNINWAVNGTVPTDIAKSEGHLLQAGDVLELFDLQSINTFRFVNSVALSICELVVTFFYERSPVLS